MSRKMWEVTVEHARTCSLDQKIYLYRPPSSELKAGVLFNMGGQGMGRLSDDKYIPSEKLSEAEKVHFSGYSGSSNSCHQSLITYIYLRSG